MKKVLLIAIFSFLINGVFGQTPNGVTVAGGNGNGSASNQFKYTNDIFVDNSGNIYVADGLNHRIQKWLPNATTGITVAGGNGEGTALNQFNIAGGVFVDNSGGVYVADIWNHRIQKWLPNATAGITVAGGSGEGAASNQLAHPNGVFVDNSGNIYVADRSNHRIQKWLLNATAGITVAGGNGEGAASNQLAYPSGVFVDNSGNIYVADSYNHRIQKWIPNATAGITVAGGSGEGAASNQLANPNGGFVDNSGNIYVADGLNHRIQKWLLGATVGITVAGGNGGGSALNQLANPNGVFVDNSGNIYVADFFNSRIQKFSQSNTTCPTCIIGITASSFTSNEHYCAAENLCSQSIIIKAQTDPKAKIIRGDLAKIGYLGLVGRTAITNAQNYPVPFLDLQADNATDTTYFKYAKVLSYLEYADGRAPFDRNRLNFNPSDTITRAAVLKVLLEAWNIDETTATGTSPFTDVTTAHPYSNYIKKAHELGIVTGSGGLFKPDIGCSREDAFLMLYRIMTNSSITRPTLAQLNAGFFTPGQYRPDNLGIGVGTDRGNFNHYTKTSFSIDGVVPLVFAHSYNSYATELPNAIFPNYMGRGWTHSFNCYIVASTTDNPLYIRRLVHYPDGKIHSYKQNPNSTWTCESIGVFDTMIDGIGFTEITTPSKIVYRFESVVGQTNTAIKLIKYIKDRNNNTLTFTNELGINNEVRLKSVADPTGRTMNFVYRTGEARNYLSEVNLSGVGAFNGRKIEFSYNSSAWDGDGIKDLTAYKENDKNGTLKTTFYDYYTLEGSEHLLKTITLPKGNVIDNTYEQRKLKSSRTMNAATVVQQMNTNWQPNYNTTSQSSTGSVSVTSGSITKTTNYTHNSNGLASRLQTTGTNPVDLEMTYGVSADPTAVSQITQMAGSTATNVNIAYQNVAPYNVSSVTTVGPNGNIVQSYTYNSFNDILTFTNGRGFTTAFGYNATGNLTSITHPIGQPTTMLRNTNGTISKVTTPAGVVTNFIYNTYGNLLTTSTPNGAATAITTSATYDALSRVISKTDARNQSVTYEYWANDLLKKMNAPLSYYVSYDYDANDNNTTVTNAKGNATTNVYHPQTDQLMSRSFGGKTESFTYNEDGSLKTYTNGRGNVFNFTYDESGRMTNDGYSAYSYNEDGTLSSIAHTHTASQGSKTYYNNYGYDNLKRLNVVECNGYITGGTTATITYSYDNNNNITAVTYPTNKTVTRTFDAKDRLTAVTDWAGRVTTYVYDDDGKILNYTLPNGTKAIYTYDAAGRPTGINHQKSSNTVICSYGFVLDQGGNHTEENIIEPYTNIPGLTAGTVSYTTDARNQTTQAGNNSYAFDANGAVTNQAGSSLSYDTKDNLKFRNGNQYFYDGTETRRSKVPISGDITNYVIDHFSNSVLSTENGTFGGYTYFYVYGPTGLLYRQHGSTGAVEYYHYDFRGSTIAMTDANQNIVRQYQYDAYGKILQQTPAVATDDNPFRYVGQHGVQYEEANLYFMRARYYDPTTGKFLSEDPIWSTNLFAYGDNNPVMNIDPLGLASASAVSTTITTSAGTITSSIANAKAESSIGSDGISGELAVNLGEIEVKNDYLKGKLEVGSAKVSGTVKPTEFEVEVKAMIIEGSAGGGINIAGVDLDCNLKAGLGAGASATVDLKKKIAIDAYLGAGGGFECSWNLGNENKDMTNYAKQALEAISIQPKGPTKAIELINGGANGQGNIQVIK